MVKKFLIRLPEELREKLERLAKEQHRSVTQQILHYLVLAVQAEENSQA